MNNLPQTPVVLNGTAAPASERLLPIYTAAELQNREFPEQRWAVPNLIPAGFTILAGPPKIGKSWLALDLALAVAQGGPILGDILVERGDVLYLALEDSERRIQARLSTLLPEDRAWPARLHFVHEAPFIGRVFAEHLDDWLEKCPEARLILVDTFARIRQVKPGNTNMYQSDYAEVAPLQRFALEKNVAVGAIHHTKKDEEVDSLASISGSFGLSGAADGALIIKRERNQPMGQLIVTGRDVNEQILDVAFDGAKWTSAGGNRSTTRSPERQAFWNALDPITSRGPQELACATGRSETATKMLLSAMLRDTQICKVARGQYCRLPNLLADFDPKMQ